MESDMTEIHNAGRIVAADALKTPPVNTKSWQLSYSMSEGRSNDLFLLC